MRKLSVNTGMSSRPTKTVPQVKRVAPPSVPDAFRHSGSSFGSVGYASSSSDDTGSLCLQQSSLHSHGHGHHHIQHLQHLQQQQATGNALIGQCDHSAADALLMGEYGSCGETGAHLTAAAAASMKTGQILHQNTSSSPAFQFSPQSSGVTAAAAAAATSIAPPSMQLTHKAAVFYHQQLALQEDQGIDLTQSPGRDSPGSSGSGSAGSRHSTASLDSGRASSSYLTAPSIRSSGGGSGISTLGTHHPSSSSSSSSSSLPSPRCSSVSSSTSVSSSALSPSQMSSTLLLPATSTAVTSCGHDTAIAEWLRDIHFDEYTLHFVTAGYDLATIARMTPEDLTAIGITKPQHRERIKQHIDGMQVGQLAAMADPLPNYVPGSIEEWLCLLRLDEYVQPLLAQGYQSVRDVTQLTWEDLEDIGIVRLGHQKKILLAIKRVKDIVSGKWVPFVKMGQPTVQHSSNMATSGLQQQTQQPPSSPHHMMAAQFSPSWNKENVITTATTMAGVAAGGHPTNTLPLLFNKAHVKQQTQKLQFFAGAATDHNVTAVPTPTPPPMSPLFFSSPASKNGESGDTSEPNVFWSKNGGLASGTAAAATSNDYVLIKLRQPRGNSATLHSDLPFDGSDSAKAHAATVAASSALAMQEQQQQHSFGRTAHSFSNQQAAAAVGGNYQRDYYELSGGSGGGGDTGGWIHQNHPHPHQMTHPQHALYSMSAATSGIHFSHSLGPYSGQRINNGLYQPWRRSYDDGDLTPTNEMTLAANAMSSYEHHSTDQVPPHPAAATVIAMLAAAANIDGGSGGGTLPRRTAAAATAAANGTNPNMIARMMRRQKIADTVAFNSYMHTATAQQHLLHADTNALHATIPGATSTENNEAIAHQQQQHQLQQQLQQSQPQQQLAASKTAVYANIGPLTSVLLYPNQQQQKPPGSPPLLLAQSTSTTIGGPLTAQSTALKQTTVVEIHHHDQPPPPPPSLSSSSSPLCAHNNLVDTQQTHIGAPLIQMLPPNMQHTGVTFQMRQCQNQELKSNLSIDSIDSIPFANENAGTIKQRANIRSLTEQQQQQQQFVQHGTHKAHVNNGCVHPSSCSSSSSSSLSSSSSSTSSSSSSSSTSSATTTIGPTSQHNNPPPPPAPPDIHIDQSGGCGGNGGNLLIGGGGDTNVLNDIGHMLANLTDELDAMLEEEKRAGLNDSE